MNLYSDFTIPAFETSCHNMILKSKRQHSHPYWSFAVTSACLAIARVSLSPVPPSVCAFRRQNETKIKDKRIDYNFDILGRCAKCSHASSNRT
jgi:hypothetical protein